MTAARLRISASGDDLVVQRSLLLRLLDAVEADVRWEWLELRDGDELGNQGEGGAFGEDATGAQDEGDADQQGDAQRPRWRQRC